MISSIFIFKKLHNSFGCGPKKCEIVYECIFSCFTVEKNIYKFYEGLSLNNKKNNHEQ